FLVRGDDSSRGSPQPAHVAEADAPRSRAGKPCAEEFDVVERDQYEGGVTVFETSEQKGPHTLEVVRHASVEQRRMAQSARARRNSLGHGNTSTPRPLVDHRAGADYPAAQRRNLLRIHAMRFRGTDAWRGLLHCGDPMPTDDAGWRRLSRRSST